MNSVHVSRWRVAARLSAAAVLGLALGAGAASAQQLTDAQKSAMRSSCRSDYMANCMSVSPGGKEALQCLEKNMAKLSPACQKAVSAVMPKAPPPAAAKPAAPPPAAKPTAKPAAAAPPPAAPPPATPPPAKPRPAAAAPPPPAAPPPAAAAPPPRHAPPPGRPTALAPPPAAAPPPTIPMGRIAHLRLRERLAIIRACNRDQAALCRGIRPGHSRLIVCLASHPQALSPYCRRTLMRALR